MKLCHISPLLLIILALVLALTDSAGAAAVGRLTQVEGRVDLLKGGKLPAIPLKVGDTVAPADVIRTKALSKAQITFVDDSILTLSPESRIAIEEFQYEPARGKRRGVLKIFQGLALAVVNKILKSQEPDFIVKTQTAIVGVRGTEFGLRNYPNSSTILNFKGRTQVGNVFPEVSRRFLKAFKVAFSFGWNNGSSRWVFLQSMQGTTVAGNLPPTQPFTLTQQDRELFMRQLATYAASQARNRHTPGPVAAPAGNLGANLAASISPPGPSNTLTILTTVTVPPKVVPQQVQAPPVTVTSPSNSGGSGSYTVIGGSGER